MCVGHEGCSMCPQSTHDNGSMSSWHAPIETVYLFVQSHATVSLFVQVMQPVTKENV
jgi:hypothetical protein